MMEWQTKSGRGEEGEASDAMDRVVRDQKQSRNQALRDQASLMGGIDESTIDDESDGVGRARRAKRDE